MATLIKDDRSDEQKSSLHWAAVAIDRARSNLGPAKGGIRRCAWACPTLEEARSVFDWIKTRSSLNEPIIADLRTYKPPANDRYFRVYVCDGIHPSECSKAFAPRPLKAYVTKNACASVASTCVTIRNEAGDRILTLTQQELSAYENSSGFPVTEISPDWIVFDLLMFVEI